jgi:hypothetical protein
LAMVTLGMFLNRSPIVCVRRKLRVWDTILEAARRKSTDQMWRKYFAHRQFARLLAGDFWPQPRSDGVDCPDGLAVRN